MTINDEIQAHIDRAQRRRREGNALAQSDAAGALQKFKQALGEIEAGIALLEKEEPPDSADPSDDDRELATLFADLWGIEGGTFRDMAKLDRSYSEPAIRAYDAGARYERDFALKSTYNFVNQLVLRFLELPALLANRDAALTIQGRDEGPSTDSVAGWLRRADEHVGSSFARRDDPAWALADLVLLAALQSSAELGPRLSRFERQVERDLDTYPYVSLLRVVRDLDAAMASETPASLRDLLTWLEQRTTRVVAPTSPGGGPRP